MFSSCVNWAGLLLQKTLEGEVFSDVSSGSVLNLDASGPLSGGDLR